MRDIREFTKESVGIDIVGNTKYIFFVYLTGISGDTWFYHGTTKQEPVYRQVYIFLNVITSKKSPLFVISMVYLIWGELSEWWKEGDEKVIC